MLIETLHYTMHHNVKKNLHQFNCILEQYLYLWIDIDVTWDKWMNESFKNFCIGPV